MTSMWKSLMAGLATPRMAALRPGQSPPLVRMPMHFAWVIGMLLPFVVELTALFHFVEFKAIRRGSKGNGDPRADFTCEA